MNPKLREVAAPTLHAPSPIPPRLPLARRSLTWIRQNLFQTWLSGISTVVTLYLLTLMITRVVRWVFFTAKWDVIPANMQLILIGIYPRDQLWRYGVIVASLVLLVALSLLVYYRPQWRKKMLRPVLIGWFLFLPWVMFLLWGIEQSSLIPRVETSSWGGLTLTLVLAMVGIACSLPIGILLALGRRSTLPVISWSCAAFVELWRGTPLVAVVFMAHLMVPIFLPDVRIDKVVRAMIGLTLFTSAYMAENVRGGLQSVGKGQIEAATALGMSPTLVTLLVLLPQALKAVIPSIVGQFISLFKDTSLVAIIGLLDLLGIARSITANPAWLGVHAEVRLFVALIYFGFCFALSLASRRIERMLGT